MKILSIAIFGVLGVLTRYSIDSLLSHLSKSLLPNSLIKSFAKPLSFPVGTFTVNILGCFIAGILYSLINQKQSPHTQLYINMIIGFCGGLTTFSSYSLQAVKMFEAGYILKPILYLVLSLVMGLVAIYLGIKLAHTR